MESLNLVQLTSLSYDDKTGTGPANAPAEGAKKEPEKKPTDAAKKDAASDKKETAIKPSPALEKKPAEDSGDKKTTP